MLRPIEAVAAVFVGTREQVADHGCRCAGQVVGIALHPSDHERLQIVELDALPVLAWEDVTPGNARLLCDGCGVLTRDVEFVEDLLEHWRDRPAVSLRG